MPWDTVRPAAMPSGTDWAGVIGPRDPDRGVREWDLSPARADRPADGRIKKYGACRAPLLACAGVVDFPSVAVPGVSEVVRKVVRPRKREE